MSDSQVTRLRLTSRSWGSRILWWALYLACTAGNAGKRLGWRRRPTKKEKGPPSWPFPPTKRQIGSCHARVYPFEGWNNVIVTPSASSSKPRPKRTILYVHGGGFYTDITILEWRAVVRLCEGLDAEVVVLPYPLAPNNGVDDTLPVLMKLYQELLKDSSQREIIFAGTSAGGNICLSLAFALHEANIPLPSQLILLSPVVDITLDNPDIPKVLPNEAILRNITSLRQHGLEWLRGSPTPVPAPATIDELHDPRVSPLFGDPSIFAAAAGTSTKLIVTTGLYDILHPDITLFVQKAERAGVTMTVIEATYHIHAWVVFLGVIPEAAMGMDWVIEAVKSYASRG